MKRTVFQRNFTLLNEVTGGLLKFISSPTGYLKLKSQGYMDLVIERLGADEISITHYYEQNGDLVPSPDMQIKISFDDETVEAITFQNSLVYWQVYSESSAVNEKYKKELNSFLSLWLRNLKAQGFYK